ncbi:CLUMA_CG014865, isoform A [Clunio marinus]|uniref:CLUMA_CG014865, isoform A n=1 Tax=Clunio marinus TaxID=568069 RepID=A0A1J1IPK1_9DIPT|nr:CLUMA_CG014865, isoform A [Clunio marinus]
MALLSHKSCSILPCTPTTELKKETRIIAFVPSTSNDNEDRHQFEAVVLNCLGLITGKNDKAASDCVEE